MKYSIGYQLPDEYISIPELCELYNDAVSNVFFSWTNEPGGRLPLCGNDKASLEMIGNVQMEELKEVKNLGKSLTLLLNSNCYGDKAVSKDLKEHTLSLVDHLKTDLDIDFITTASPFIADLIKKEFKDDIKVTASVNMKISTVTAMKQLSSMFDGFYMAKECNRNFDVIKNCTPGARKTKKACIYLPTAAVCPIAAFKPFMIIL